jgi:hypothetical protein
LVGRPATMTGRIHIVPFTDRVIEDSWQLSPRTNHA